MPDVKSLVDQIIAMLRTAQGAELNEALLDVAFYFEKARGLPLAHCWSKAVVDALISEADTARLKTAVVEFVERGGDGCWTLSKCDDPQFKDLFIRLLRQELQGDAAKLYQAMIALDNLGESVFGGRSSKSILDKDENRKSAREYLDSLRECTSDK